MATCLIGLYDSPGRRAEEKLAGRRIFDETRESVIFSSKAEMAELSTTRLALRDVVGDPALRE